MNTDSHSPHLSSKLFYMEGIGCNCSFQEERRCVSSRRKEEHKEWLHPFLFKLSYTCECVFFPLRVAGLKRTQTSRSAQCLQAARLGRCTDGAETSPQEGLKRRAVSTATWGAGRGHGTSTADWSLLAELHTYNQGVWSACTPGSPRLPNVL